MDRREFLKTAGIAGGGLLLLPSCKTIGNIVRKSQFDGQYDFDDLLIDDFQQLVDGVARYDTKFKISMGGNERDIEAYGVGFTQGDKLITCCHTLDMDTMAMRTPFGVMMVPVEVLERHAYLGDEEVGITHTDKDYDLAVLEIPSGHKDVMLGNSDELKRGHQIGTAGYPLDTEEIVRLGRVVADKYTKEEDFLKEVPPEDMFMSWYTNMPGDSGGAVYAFRDGEPEIVGMVKAMKNGYGFDHKINSITERLKKYI